MTHLISFARSISRKLLERRAYLLVLLTVIALLVAQPLLVRAKPALRAHSQLAEIAQVTQSPSEEPDEEEPEDDDPTATVTKVAQTEDQQNIEGGDVAASDVISVEIPAENIQADEAIALPFDWQGDSTISASDLAAVAPPLVAEVIQGNFQITYVSTETGNSIRVLPVASEGELGSLRIGLSIDQSSTILPFPAGEMLLLQASARVYAPAATTRLVIADDYGSSSVAMEGLNWNDYQVVRAIAEDATKLELILEWSNVPANGWLELSGLSVALVPSTDASALSPTDTPQIIEAVSLSPTAPPQTPTPTAISKATATSLPTATPIPDSVSGQTAATAPISNVAILTPTATFIIVTSTPTPKDVYEEATRVAQATEWARILGPVTATPPNLTTPTPTITPIVLVNTPTPANEATAVQMNIFATAVAFTTGTPTPLPPNATIVIATETSVPPTATSRPTLTPTPIFVLLDDLPVVEPTTTPVVPEILYNKIVFLSSIRGNPNQPSAMLMNPDGTGVGLLTTNFFYNIVANQDTYSADSRFRVYSLREGGGAAHNGGLVQLFYDDSLYSSTQHQLTYFGAGVAWAPAWSPRSETIAFVSSESGNDEIWVTNTNQWPATQLTKNAWEWDHHPSYSPDGSQIVFSSNRVTGRRQLWIMSASGENQAQLTNFTFEAWNPVWVKYVTPGEAAAQP